MSTNSFNIITFVTTDYISILNKYFLQTIPKEFESVTIKCVAKNGYFRHDSYAKTLEIIRTKFIIDQIKAHKNEILMMIDADVIFKGVDFSDEVIELLKTNDIVFQYNHNWYNFGVFALNCTDNNLKIFNELYEKLNQNINYCKTLDVYTEDIHDQHIINDIVRFSNVKHTSLPLHFSAGHFSERNEEKWVLYHATNTYSLEEKISVLESYKNKI